MVEVEINQKKLTNGGDMKINKWKWRVVGAVIAVLLATSLTPLRHSRKFNFIRSPCRCSEVILYNSLSIFMLYLYVYMLSLSAIFVEV